MDPDSSQDSSENSNNTNSITIEAQSNEKIPSGKDDDISPKNQRRNSQRSNFGQSNSLHYRSGDANTNINSNSGNVATYGSFGAANPRIAALKSNNNVDRRDTLTRIDSQEYSEGTGYQGYTFKGRDGQQTALDFNFSDKMSKLTKKLNEGKKASSNEWSMSRDKPYSDFDNSRKNASGSIYGLDLFNKVPGTNPWRVKKVIPESSIIRGMLKYRSNDDPKKK